MGRNLRIPWHPSEVIGQALRTPKADVRKPYQVLSEEEIARVLQGAATRRDNAILAVFFGAGLCVAELTALDLADVTENTRRNHPPPCLG